MSDYYLMMMLLHKLVVKNYLFFIHFELWVEEHDLMSQLLQLLHIHSPIYEKKNDEEGYE